MGSSVDPINTVSGGTGNVGGISSDLRLSGAGQGTYSPISAKEESGAKQADGFVYSPEGYLGIDQQALRQKFLSQYQPQQTGNEVSDQAKQDLDFCTYVNKAYGDKADEVFALLKSLPPEEQEKSRAFLAEVDEKATAEAKKMGMSADQAKEYKNLMMFKAISEKYNGSALGDRSREAYVLGSYDRDLYNMTTAKYGLPNPGEKNPYNEQGQSYYNSAGSVDDPRIQEAIQRQQIMQFLTLMCLFNSCGMGCAPFMLSPWMMQ